MLVGALFKKFGMFLNTPHTCHSVYVYRSNVWNFEFKGLFKEKMGILRVAWQETTLLVTVVTACVYVLSLY
jgi:hypothetical protein